MKEVYDFLLNKLKLKNDDVIVVGVSYGPDSMALLYILQEIRKRVNINIICAHVNHNVRKESIKEKNLLEKYCLEKNIVFEVMTIEKYSDDNFHNEARNIRYNFFNGLVEKYNANYLMTAHHGDDLMETILMRIVRGSTLKGYSGFKRIVDMKNYQLVRPLITVTKSDLEEFNKINKIPYAIDASNKKSHYTRNRYRKKILPFLKKEDCLVHEKFLKFSENLAFYDDYITKETNKYLLEVFNSNQLNLKKFKALDYIWQRNVIAKILEGFYQDDLILINDKHVTMILNIINSNKSNSCVYLPNSVRVLKSYDTLTIGKEYDSICSYEVEFIDYAYLPNGKVIEKIEETEENGNDICRLCKNDYVEPLYIRTRKHGDKIHSKGMNGHQKLKDIFINKKIPINDRDIWPVVVDATDKILWIPGIKKSKIDKSNKEKYDIILRYH